MNTAGRPIAKTNQTLQQQHPRSSPPRSSKQSIGGPSPSPLNQFLIVKNKNSNNNNSFAKSPTKKKTQHHQPQQHQQQLPLDFDDFNDDLSVLTEQCPPKPSNRNRTKKKTMVMPPPATALASPSSNCPASPFVETKLCKLLQRQGLSIDLDADEGAKTNKKVTTATTPKTPSKVLRMKAMDSPTKSPRRTVGTNNNNMTRSNNNSPSKSPSRRMVMVNKSAAASKMIKSPTNKMQNSPSKSPRRLVVTQKNNAAAPGSNKSPNSIPLPVKADSNASSSSSSASRNNNNNYTTSPMRRRRNNSTNAVEVGEDECGTVISSRSTHSIKENEQKLSTAGKDINNDSSLPTICLDGSSHHGSIQGKSGKNGAPASHERASTPVTVAESATEDAVGNDFEVVSLAASSSASSTQEAETKQQQQQQHREKINSNSNQNKSSGVKGAQKEESPIVAAEEPLVELEESEDGSENYDTVIGILEEAAPVKSDKTSLEQDEQSESSYSESYDDFPGMEETPSLLSKKTPAQEEDETEDYSENYDEFPGIPEESDGTGRDQDVTEASTEANNDDVAACLPPMLSEEKEANQEEKKDVLESTKASEAKNGENFENPDDSVLDEKEAKRQHIIAKMKALDTRLESMLGRLNNSAQKCKQLQENAVEATDGYASDGSISVDTMVLIQRSRAREMKKKKKREKLAKERKCVKDSKSKKSSKLSDETLRKLEAAVMKKDAPIIVRSQRCGRGIP